MYKPKKDITVLFRKEIHTFRNMGFQAFSHLKGLFSIYFPRYMIVTFDRSAPMPLSAAKVSLSIIAPSKRMVLMAR